MELALLFVGVVVALIVQGIKIKFKTTTFGTLLVVAVLSVVGAVGAFLLKQYGFYENFIQILVSAGAFYTFIIKNISDGGIDIKKGLTE